MGNQQTKSASRSKPPSVTNEELIRIVMLGKTGAGKSATGNTIVGEKCFKCKFSPKSVTQHCDKVFSKVDGQWVAVIDTPGLFDTRNPQEETIQDIVQCIAYASPGPNIFLIIIKLDRFTEEEKQTVENIQKIFGEEAHKYSMVLFTNGEKLKGTHIKEFLKDSKDLQELVAKCNSQYHVFSNKTEDPFQVTELLEKIQKINEKNERSYYTTEVFQKAETTIEEEKQRILTDNEEEIRKEGDKLRKEMEDKFDKILKEDCSTTASNNEELIRIVMVGKTGAGKSATGNTILGEKRFKSEFDLESVTTDCKKAYGDLDGQWVAVIDTPGLFDTRNTEEETDKDLAQCIAYACPGPHIFLIIMRLGKFTEEEKQTVQKIQKLFGKEACKYSMVLFTHGDQLKGKPIKDVLKKCKDLQQLVAKCNGQYHVFNNDARDRSQVKKLFEKIKKINEQNEGSYYSTEKFQKTEIAIEEEKQRILKQRAGDIHKEQDQLKQEIEEDFQQPFIKAGGDKERENKLKQECEEEIRKRVKKLKEKVEQDARKTAEESDAVKKVIKVSHMESSCTTQL